MVLIDTLGGLYKGCTGLGIAENNLIKHNAPGEAH